MRLPYPVPQQETRVPQNFARYERIPLDVVGKPVINHRLAPLLEARGLPIEHIIERSLYFSTGNADLPENYTDSSLRVAVHGRSELNIQFMEPLVVDGSPYSQITVKGAGVKPGTMSGGGADKPVGFFGLKDSLRDMEISDFLAEQGLPVSRVVAVIPLDRGKLKHWFESMRRDGTLGKYDPALELSKISKHDQPALVVRLTNPRMEDYTFSIKYPHLHVQMYNRRNIERQFLQLVSAELRARGGTDAFLQHLNLTTGTKAGDQLIPMIEEIGKRSGTIDWEDFFASSHVHKFMFQLMSYRWGQNARKIAQLYNNGQFPYTYYGPIHDQDVSVNGQWNDFELTRKGVEMSAQDFIETTRAHHDSYFAKTRNFFDAGLGEVSFPPATWRRRIFRTTAIRTIDEA